MTLNDAIISAPDTGECDIDIGKAVRYFTKKCFIYRYGDNFRLIRIRNKRAVAMKITISKTDTEQLIKVLNLDKLKSRRFTRAVTYCLPELIG